MKLKIFSALLLGAVLATSAQGYKDGIDYYKADQFDNAKELLQRNLNAPGTDKALTYYYLGQIAINPQATLNPDRAAASNYFTQGIQADPNCAYNYVGLGTIDLLNGQVQNAQKHFKEAEKLAKKDYEVLVDIARAYYNVDKTRYAKEIEKYKAEANKKSKYKEPAFYIFEGDIALDAADNNEAARQFEQAIAVDSINPAAFVKYAQAYFRTTNESNRQYALRALENFLRRDPNSALVQRELAEKYFDNDEWKKAAVQYGKYIQNPNHFPADESRYAVLLYYSEDYAGAQKVVDGILARDPKDFLANRLSLLNYDALKQYDAAVAAGEKFFQLGEGINANDYTVYIDALMNNGNTEKAIEVITDGMTKFPDKKDTFAKILYGHVSDLADKAFDMEDGSPDQLATVQQALTELKPLLEADPENLSYLYMNSNLVLLSKQYSVDAEVAEANQKLLDQLLALGAQPTPDDRYASYLKRAYTILGAYNVSIKNNAEAKKCYENLIKIDPENASAKRFLGK